MTSRIVFLVAVCMVTTDAFSSLGEVVAEQQAVTVAFTEFGNKFFEDDAAGLQPFFADGARAVIFDKVTHETFVFEPGEMTKFIVKDYTLVPGFDGYSLLTFDVYVDLDASVRQAFIVSSFPASLEERGLRVSTFLYDAEHMIISSMVAS